MTGAKSTLTVGASDIMFFFSENRLRREGEEVGRGRKIPSAGAGWPIMRYYNLISCRRKRVQYNSSFIKYCLAKTHMQSFQIGRQGNAVRGEVRISADALCTNLLIIINTSSLNGYRYHFYSLMLYPHALFYHPSQYQLHRIFPQLFKIHTMSFLLNLFVRSSNSSSRNFVSRTLKQMKIDSLQPLPDNYHEMLFSPPKDTHPRVEVLAEVVLYLSQATTQAAIVKIYTIIMCAVRMADYGPQQCQALQFLHETNTHTTAEKPDRLIEIQKSCRSYLAKLSSMSDLYFSALSSSKSSSAEESHITLFRMMNQFSLLFPFFNTAINTVGRYYRENHLYFKQFYRVWRSQVLLGYLAIKRAIDQMLSDYKSKEPDVLECFLGSVPQIQLLCDQMEAMITNKYYKGKSPNKKVYFNEETLQEIDYYRKEMQKEGKVEQDFIRTAEDDFFAFQK